MINAKKLSFLAVVIQQTSLVLVIRYSKTRIVSIPYLTSVVVFSAELFKLILNFFLEIVTSRRSTESSSDVTVVTDEISEIEANKDEILTSNENINNNHNNNSISSIISGLINVCNKESLTLVVPAILYVIQNNLLFYALSNLSVPTYQITNQGKLLTTAIISRIMLKKEISRIQYFAIFLLGLGVAVVHISEYQANLGSKRPGEIRNQSGDQWLGLLAVFLSCVTSGFSGVYFELILKTTKQSVYCRNFHLAFYSLVLASFYICYSDSDQIHESGMFQGFDKMVLLIVVMQGMTGFVVSMMFKYSTAVLKGFATSIAVVVATIASFFFFDTSLNATFALGATMVTLAVKLYSTKNEVFASKTDVKSPVPRAKYSCRQLLPLAVIIVLLSLTQLITAPGMISTVYTASTQDEVDTFNSKMEDRIKVGDNQTLNSSLGEEFFSPYPYVFTEGCLETFSRSKSWPPYQYPHMVGDMHDLPANISSGVFDVPPNKSFMNAVVIVIDSLSRAQIMAYMPRVRQLLLELHKSGAHDKVLFPFVNSLSLDGTTPYLFSALLSGMEFGASERRTWMHDELKTKGYVSKYLGRVWPIANEFQLRFPEVFSRMVPKGAVHSNKKPVKVGFVEDYALRYEHIKKLKRCKNSSFCKVGGEVRTDNEVRSTEELSLQVEDLLQFWRESLNSPKLAILHLVASHSPSLPESMAPYDNELADLLHTLIKSRNMNIIFTTDHGRLDDEHSFPFPLTAAIFCEKALNEERRKNMMHNSKRIVTMYDIHHTLRHLLLTDPDVEFRDGVKRGFEKSMLVSKIAQNRTCNSAGVPPSVCPCLARSWAAVKDPAKLKRVRAALEKLLRGKEQTGCAAFDIKKMIILSPKKTLSTRRGLAVDTESFVRAEIHVQENVIFEVRGYMMWNKIQLHNLKQTTSYRKFEVCTPKGGNPQFCICEIPSDTKEEEQVL